VRDLAPWLGDYSVSGVRRYLLGVLREAAARPDTVAALFLDEMGLHRWPEPQPVAEHGDETNRQWRWTR